MVEPVPGGKPAELGCCVFSCRCSDDGKAGHLFGESCLPPSRHSVESLPNLGARSAFASNGRLGGPRDDGSFLLALRGHAERARPEWAKVELFGGAGSSCRRPILFFSIPACQHWEIEASRQCRQCPPHRYMPRPRALLEAMPTAASELDRGDVDGGNLTSGSPGYAGMKLSGPSLVEPRPVPRSLWRASLAFVVKRGRLLRARLR
jgi:hypothetical protein